MDTSFLGAGWRSHYTNENPDEPRSAWLCETGQIALSGGEDNIQQAIWLILGTAKGERVMRPDFGCGIHDLVFAVMSPTTAARAADEVRQALMLWEPRIEDLVVTAEADHAEPNRLLIEIQYRVRATNNRFNMVYPFYLE